MPSRLVRVALCVFLGFLVFMAGFVLASPQNRLDLPQVLNNPQVNLPVHFDVSPPLGEMMFHVTPPAGTRPALSVRHPKGELLKGTAQQGQGISTDSVLQMSTGPLVNGSVGLNILGVGNGFPGYSVPDAPPDVNLAVGDTQVLQWVNVSYAVFDKTSGTIVAGPVAGNAFWSGFGGPCQSDNSGDPIIQWDKLAHRWVATQNTFQGSYNTCIAVSQTADAMGSYYRFAFPQNGFPDYPKLGLMPDAYYQSQNNFGPSGNSFQGAHVCAYERAKLLIGDSTAKQVCFQTGTFDDSLLPGDLDSAGTLPPSGQPEVFLGSIDNGTPAIYEYLFHADFTTPASSTFTGGGGTMQVSGVASFNLACGGGACIPQPSPGELLDSLGDRLMYRLAYRNIGTDHQAWLVSHSVTAGSTVGERWYEFHAPENSTNLSVFQQGTFAPDSNYRWMGSIAMDQNQDIALGYSVSSSSVYPSIYYTGHASGDAAGTMEAESQIVAGTGSQVNTSNRWGDYTSMALDSADDCTFWYTAEYYQVTASFDWSTRLASFKFSNCGGPNFALSASPSSQTVTQGGSTAYTATVTPENGYSATVNLSVSGCPSNTTCSLNPTSSGSPNYPSSSLSVQTTATTPTGTFTLTVTGSDGTLTHTATVDLVVNGPPDFSLSASPSSRTVTQGNGTSYTVTATPVNGYSGSETLSITGLPSGANATFNPNPLGVASPNSSSSTLSVTTASTTPTGTYTLTVTATDGALTHTTTVTLVVNPPAAADFSVTAAPGSRTVRRGTSASYTVSVTPSGGFSGTVSFSLSGLPSNATASFSPPSVTGSGSSSLTVSTSKSTGTGNFTLTIKGTSGSLNHSVTVGLKVH